jgi:glycosidase
VQTQEKNPSSLLRSFRRLVSLRRREPALANHAGFRLLHGGYPLVYERAAGRRTVLVVINPRREPATFKFPSLARPAVALERLEGTAKLVAGNQSLTVKCPGLAYGIFLRQK